MQSEIIIGILSLCGTLIGTIGGILASNRLTLYRLEQLEDKVNKHNNLIERMYKCEERITVIETEVNEMRKDIEDDK